MTQMQQWTVEKPWLEPHCLLGEGPFYEKATKTIRFVDIEKKQLHTASLAEGLSSLQSIQLDVSASVTADIAGLNPQDKILLGTKYGLAVFDRRTEEVELLKAYSEPSDERVRGNDGAADPNGRFWLGTMTDLGWGSFNLRVRSLYIFTSDSRKEFLKDLTIPNSLGWSPDQKTMYFTHTAAAIIHAYDYDTTTATASNPRVFYTHRGSGGPDGFRVDVDGNIWHAIYGEGRVVKISPAGEIVGEVRLPTRNITCVQFAETELVITTAADGEGEAESREYGGAVFKVDVGTRGLELFEFRM